MEKIELGRMTRKREGQSSAERPVLLRSTWYKVKSKDYGFRHNQLQIFPLLPTICEAMDKSFSSSKSSPFLFNNTRILTSSENIRNIQLL